MSGLTKEQIDRLLGPAKVAVLEVVSPKLVAKKRGHIPEAVVIEVLEDIKNNRTYRQIKEDYAVSIGWIHKVRHNKTRK